MKGNIPYSCPSTKPNKPWFNATCSRAINNRNNALKAHLLLQTNEFHANYISLRIVATLSLYYRYYNKHCSSELHSLISEPMHRPRATRQAIHSHPFSVELPRSRLYCYEQCFWHRTSSLWNKLYSTDFPSSYDMLFLKRRVAERTGFLNGQWLSR